MSAAMPVPEPPPVTMTTWPLCVFMYCSAQRWPRITIVSEPLTVIGLAAHADAVARVRAVRSESATDFFMFPSGGALELVLELDGPQVVVRVREAARAGGDVGLDRVVRDR